MHFITALRVCKSVGKADLLSDHFDSKQSREAVDLPLTCHPPPSFTTFAFRSSEVRRLLLDLDPYVGTDPLGLFPLFLKRTGLHLVTRGALVPHRYTYARPRCRTLQYSRTFIPLSVSFWNDLANPVFDGVGLAGFKSRANAFLFT